MKTDVRRERASKESVPPAARNRRRWFVASYDSPNDKRRLRIMKVLSGYGARVQYSVFECILRPRDFEQMCSRLREIVDKTEDDLRIYPLCGSCLHKVVMLGNAEVRQEEPFIIVGGGKVLMDD